MCGIAGFIGPSKLIHPKDGEMILNRMMTRIQYRGPDDCGLYLEEGMGMGNVRLSIIDIGGGDQPICNEDGSLWIVYNGEIFNYIELKNDLLKRGHRFKTLSDTEVLLHLYEEYGSDFLHFLNGQFAFAIWNRRKKECFFARDRVGIRPFFYTLTNNHFIFGSEIKSILEFPGVERSFSNEALKDIFTFWTTLSPKTVFKGIYELPAGHFALFRNGELCIKKYWLLNDAQRSSIFNGSFSDTLDQFRYLLTDSVALRLRSDVPVAAYLSGGLDSSAMIALIRKLAPNHLNTFSIGFSDKQFDESKYQNEVSAYFNTKHYSINCSKEDIAEWFPDVIWHAETPLLRTAPAPMLGLSSLVNRHGIKVVITGEGADEAFGGYNIFKEALIRQFWARQPQSKLRPLLLKRLYPYLPYISQASSGILRMFFGYKLEEINSPVYSHLLRWQNTSKIQNHFSFEMGNSVQGYNPIEEYSSKLASLFEGATTLKKAQFIETDIFMTGYLLSSQGDRMAMANSVEGRFPFLDYRILEFANSLPDKFKIKGMNEKFILKELMKDELPKSVIERQKQAYRAPIHEIFLGEDAPDYILELLDAKRLQECGIFNPDSVNDLIKKIKKSQFHSEVDNMAIVGIVSTQLLFRLFLSDFIPLKDSEIIRGVVRNEINYHSN